MSNNENMEVDEKTEAMDIKDTIKNDSMEVKDAEEGKEEESSEESSEDEEEGEERTYLPGVKLEEGEELEIDEAAYVVYHQASLGPPCLSFDMIPELCQSDFPLSVTAVAGTQAAKVTANSIIVFRMSNLHSVKAVEDEDDEDDDDYSEEERPVMRMAGIKHPGCVNRLRYACIGPTPVVAAWAETGSVSVYNLAALLQRLELPGKEVAREEGQPLQTFTGHTTEGFALDWNSLEAGVLASGDCAGGIHLWRPGTGGSWAIQSKAYTSHTASVEDIRWSPTEANVMATAACDKTIKIWDVRAEPSKACMLTQAEAHKSDVNVIDWNRSDPFIVSGGDDGNLKIWDLRNFGGSSCGGGPGPVATFGHHAAPVTSVEWLTDDSTVFASSGADDQVALWDLALEKDTEAAVEDPQVNDLPPQLLFIHQGLKDVKEIHWHQKIPGLLLATSHTGFDVFKTISV